MKRYRCYVCDWKGEFTTFRKYCPKCKSALYIENTELIIKEEGTNIIEKYCKLLPIMNEKTVPVMRGGNTPLVRAYKTEERYGFKKLLLKDETKNPTRSTKDRISTVSLAMLSQFGIKEIGIASTGNSSTAYAKVMDDFPDMRLHVFCAKDFIHRHNFETRDNVIAYTSNLNYSDMCKKAKEYCEMNKITWEGGFYNVARREGLKTAYLEIFDECVICPDYIVQAISSGMGLLAAYQGIQEYYKMGKISKIPQIIAVQQESCCPMVKAWNQKEYTADCDTKHPKGLAEAILRGSSSDVYPYIRDIVKETQGHFVAVSDGEIIDAKEELQSDYDIIGCYASGAALAGAIKLRKQGFIKENETVAVNITGGIRDESIIPKILKDI